MAEAVPDDVACERKRGGDMATFLVSHGAWSAGWAWKKMHPLMAARGHRLFTPTHTGLGERNHLAHPGIDLETHIADILGVIAMEDMRGVILIGHSYGGMVATGVAARARDWVAKLIYVDAFAPRDGDSVFSLTPHREQAVREAVERDGEGWRIPPNPMPPDTPDADRAWAEPRRFPQPLKTFEQPLTLRGGEPTSPRHFIYCTRHPPNDPFRQFLDRARREGWGTDEIDSSHNPHITVPDALMEVLDKVARS
jgi:pimeloyl-ACP methyl ester carboxylesterase